MNENSINKLLELKSQVDRVLNEFPKDVCYTSGIEHGERACISNNRTILEQIRSCQKTLREATISLNTFESGFNRGFLEAMNGSR